jgi:hypothetical protein
MAQKISEAQRQQSSSKYQANKPELQNQMVPSPLTNDPDNNVAGEIKDSALAEKNILAFKQLIILMNNAFENFKNENLKAPCRFNVPALEATCTPVTCKKAPALGRHTLLALMEKPLKERSVSCF